MENATKALLIVAAVLIVIIIIALGVSLLSNSEDAVKQTEAVGGQIGDSTESAKDKIINSLGTLSKKGMTEKQLTNFLKELGDETQVSMWVSSYFSKYNEIRVYKATDEDIPECYSDELWKKSEVVNKFPDNYYIYDEFGDNETKRYIFILVEK